MSKLRQTIPARQARAGVRPGTTTQQRTATTPSPSQAQQQDKRLEQIVDQGGVGVWRVKGNDTPIYALSREQAQAEAQRRGVKGELSLSGYVKLSDADRASLQQTADAGSRRKSESSRTTAPRRSLTQKAEERAATRPSNDPEDIYKQTLAREALRLAKRDLGPSELIAREQRAKEAGAKLAADREAASVSSALEKYKSGEDAYDITSALRDNAVSAKQLLDAGFSSPDVNQAIQNVSWSSFPEGSEPGPTTVVASYVREVPWRHTSVTQVDWGSMVKDLGTERARTVLRQTGHTADEADEIINYAKAQQQLAPYTDQFGRISPIDAIRGGVSASTLRAAGIDDDTIADATYYANTIAQVAPLEKGKVTPIAERLMMHVPAETLSVRAKRFWDARFRSFALEPYKVKEGEYNVKAALDAGVDPLILQRAGVPAMSILKAEMAEMPRKAEAAPKVDMSSVRPEQSVAKAGILGGALTLPYRNADGTYDLQRMVEDKRLSVKQMRDAGFTDAQITAAINAAMRSLSERDVLGSDAPVRVDRERDIASNIMTHLDADLPESGVLMPKLQELQQTINDKTRGTNPVLRVAGGAAVGLSYTIMPVAMAEDLLFTPGWSQKAEKAGSYVEGAVSYVLNIPVALINDPYWTLGEIAGIIGGPRAALRAARSARVWVDPYGVPARAVGIEFSTGKIPVGKLNKADLGRAVAQAERQILAGKLRGTVKVGDVEVQYRGTPLQHTVGEVAFNATTDSARLATKQVLTVPEGQAMYFSPYVTPRFMATSAGGRVATRPGVIAVLTDASRVRNVPRSQLKAATGSERFILRADEGLYGPSKIYKHSFETEVVASPGTSFTKAPTNLRSRILGEKAGEFFVQYDGPTVPGLTKGQLVPVHVFLDRGVMRTAPSPSALYAAKLLTIYESLKDVGQKVMHPSRTVRDAMARQGPAGVRQIEAQRVNTARTLVQELEREAKAKAKTETAYRRALVDAYEQRARAMFEGVSRSAIASYARTPATFERAYAARLEANLRTAARVLTVQRAYETVRSEPRRLPTRSENSLPRWMRDDREERRSTPTATRTDRAVYEQPRRTTVTPPSPPPPATPPSVPRIPPSRPPTKPDTPPVKKHTARMATDERMEDTGRVQWKQGAYWIMVEPPPTEGERQRNVSYSRRPFWGVRKVKGSPEETFSRQGQPPKQFLYEMGIAHASIHSYEKPHLRWRQTRKAKRRGRVM